MIQKFLDFDLDFGAFDNAVNKLNKEESNISNLFKNISGFLNKSNVEEPTSQKDKNTKVKP